MDASLEPLASYSLLVMKLRCEDVLDRSFLSIQSKSNWSHDRPCAQRARRDGGTRIRSCRRGVDAVGSL